MLLTIFNHFPLHLNTLLTHGGFNYQFLVTIENDIVHHYFYLIFWATSFNMDLNMDTLLGITFR